MKNMLLLAVVLLFTQVGNTSSEDILLWSVPEGSSIIFTRDFLLPANITRKDIGSLNYLEERHYFDCELRFSIRKKTRVVRAGTRFQVRGIRNPCVNCHENYSAELSLRSEPNLLAIRCMNAGGSANLTVSKVNLILAQVGIILQMSEPEEDR